MDKQKLMDAMRKKRMTKDEMCRRLGMSRSAFYRKCNGISEFTLGEVRDMIEILQLEEPLGIFFAEKVS